MIRCDQTTLQVKVVLVVVLVGLVSAFQPVAPASAQLPDACDVVFPLDALTGTNAKVSSAAKAPGAPVTAFVNPSTVDPTTLTQLVTGAGAVAAGGGMVAAAPVTIGAGSLAGGVGVFMAAGIGTCSFIDWVGFDTKFGNWLPELPGLITGMTWPDAPVGCGTVGVSTAAQCMRMNYQQLASTWTLVERTTCGKSYTGAGTQYGPTPGTPTIPTAYYQAYGCGTESNAGWISPTSGQKCPFLPKSSHSSCTSAVPTSVGGVTFYDDSTSQLGGPSTQGTHPLQQIVLHPLASSAFVSAAVYARPDIKRDGWLRRWESHEKCKRASDQDVVDASAVSEWFLDGKSDFRWPVAKCPTGYAPWKSRVFKVTYGTPTPWTTGALWSVVHPGVPGEVQLVWDFQLPDEAVAVGRSNFYACLDVGSNCGSPTTTAGQCFWGSHAVVAQYCDPTRQGNTVPEARPKTTPQLETVANQGVVGTATYLAGGPTLAPGGSGGSGGVTTTTSPGATTTLPAAAPTVDTTSNDGAEGCWPSGWGLMRPDKWVLQPMKCAFTWAVVPPEAEWQEVLDDFDALRENRPPFQWLNEVVLFVGDASVTFESWATAGPACFELMNTDVCPRELDVFEAPAWAVQATLVGLWTMVLVAVARWL